MKAIAFEEPGLIKSIDIAEPSEPGPGQALVRTHRVGVCGTDIGGFLGKMPLFQYPRIPGHELGVEVLAVGDGVTNVSQGDRCSVEPYMNCGTCFPCRQGNSNCCTSLKVIGVMQDGGLRDRFLIRADKLHKSAKLSFEQLALVETLAIGAHAVGRGGARAGEDVLVIGAGPIGLSVIEFVRLAGARITVMDLSEDRLAFCQNAYGIDQLVRSGSDSDEITTLSKLTGGDLYPLVIDATGSHHAMSAALDYLAPTGRLVYVGITAQNVSFPHKTMHLREATLLSSRNALPSEFRPIIEHIEQGRIDTDRWITRRMPFADVASQFAELTTPAPGAIKTIIELA
jgi:alcohol dehydrogenase